MRNRLILVGLMLNFVSFGQDAANQFEQGIVNLNSSIHVFYDAEVQESINVYLNNPSQSRAVLEDAQTWIPEIQASLAEAELPTELAFLAMSLSAFQHARVSEVGGSGFWQMRYAVAKTHGLHISTYVDERRSPIPATHAAISYLKELYTEYQNWLIVVAAFNADPVEIKRSYRNAGGALVDYKTIKSFLPSQQRRQVAQFIAAQYFYVESSNLGFPSGKSNEELSTAVEITDWITLDKLAKALEVDVEVIKDLNPMYKKNIIPKSQKDYFAYIPLHKEERFQFLGDSIYRFGEVTIPNADVIPGDQPLPDNAILIDGTGGVNQIVEPAQPKPKQTSSGKVKIYYTVRKGDVLGKIADYYDVGVSSIKRWNGLRSDNINIDARLAIYVPASKVTYYRQINKMSASQKANIAAKD